MEARAGLQCSHQAVLRRPDHRSRRPTDPRGRGCLSPRPVPHTPPMTPLGEGGPCRLTLTIPLMKVINDIRRLNANHLLTLSVTPRGEMTPIGKGSPLKNGLHAWF